MRTGRLVLQLVSASILFICTGPARAAYGEGDVYHNAACLHVAGTVEVIDGVQHCFDECYWVCPIHASIRQGADPAYFLDRVELDGFDLTAMVCQGLTCTEPHNCGIHTCDQNGPAVILPIDTPAIQDIVTVGPDALYVSVHGGPGTILGRYTVIWHGDMYDRNVTQGTAFGETNTISAGESHYYAYFEGDPEFHNKIFLTASCDVDLYAAATPVTVDTFPTVSSTGATGNESVSYCNGGRVYIKVEGVSGTCSYTVAAGSYVSAPGNCLPALP